MLCALCEGTEHSPAPHGFLDPCAVERFELRDCTTCGKRLWDNCVECGGKGRKLHIFGQCSSCGQSILYWLACKSCHGTGKVYHPAHACVPDRAPRVTRISPAASSRSPESGNRPAAA